MQLLTWNPQAHSIRKKWLFKKETRMQVDITARHFTPSVQLKEMVYEKLKKIEKFNNDIISCRVILTKETNFEEVEIVIHGKGHHFISHENFENFEKSLISAVDKITIQIKKQHEKLVNH